ncbi:bifunctional DNA primase/polymerase [Marimonas lutisalis]|uniref:bifunctional DNA primase/polymerase n=1 Tax=Marimonas lutisalis TaxID=2545756 RepID=UPI0010F593CE|nr:bifunctional DNA primase/polymerase [Marimonas lutisalis]
MKAGVLSQYPGDDLLKEITRLRDEGFSLIPLGGNDGKRPLVAFKDRHPLPKKTILDMVRAGDATGYGIRLQGMLVLDVDAADIALVQSLEKRFGKTSVKNTHARRRLSSLLPTRRQNQLEPET